MSLDASNHARHALIARPAGLPGYTPREWCAVCGKTSINLEKKKCVDVNCPNICHTSCLADNENFDCLEVTNLRAALNIQDRVIYVNTQLNEPDDTDRNADNELIQLEKRELVAIIARLQTEITRKNSILSFFGSVSDDIASKRDAVVTVLQFIDNIIATKSSLAELEVKSCACSASPDKIDEDWSAAVASDQDLNAWWTSEKPRKLRKICHLETGGNTTSTGVQQPSDTIHQQDQENQLGNGHQAIPGSRQHQRNRQNLRSQQPTQSRYSNIRNNNNFVPRNRIPTRNSRSNTNFSGQHFSSVQDQQRSTPQNKPTCSFCRRRGHTEADCLKRLKCDYCHRTGHKSQDCHTKHHEERQERFFRSLASEQAQQSAFLIQSFQRLIPFNQANHIPHPPGPIAWPTNTNHQAVQNPQFQQYNPTGNR